MKILVPTQEQLKAGLDAASIIKIDPESFGFVVGDMTRTEVSPDGQNRFWYSQTVNSFGTTTDRVLLRTVDQGLQGAAWLAEHPSVRENAANKAVVQRAWNVTGCRLGAP